MIFSRKASIMKKSGVKPDALAAAIAIANGARRRQSRRERLRGIAPIVALTIGIALRSSCPSVGGVRNAGKVNPQPVIGRVSVQSTMILRSAKSHIPADFTKRS
jgi:hypothetical protein